MAAVLKIKEFEQIVVLQFGDGSLGKGSNFWRQLPAVTHRLFLVVDEEQYRILRWNFSQGEI